VTDPTESVESLMDEEDTAAVPTATDALPPTLTTSAAEKQREPEATTNMYPLDNEVRIDSEEIVDVIRNFIAEKDPMLELFLTICFVHPHCFKAGQQHQAFKKEDYKLKLCNSNTFAG
jgi:hypothetical protein